MTEAASNRTGRLSPREREIALAYADGASHKEIGARLFIAPTTVRTHLSAIYRKLGVSSKIELLRALSEAGAVAGAAAGHAWPAALSDEPAGAGRGAAIAIMPLSGGRGRAGHIGDGLVQDIITRLAKLRSVRVIARGSVFALAARGVDAFEAARLLKVDYLASGSLGLSGTRAALAVELTDTRSGDVVWADSFAFEAGDTLAAIDELGDRIVVALAREIEAAERNRAMLKPPGSLDAWQSFHRGLWHMYRFTAADNQQAQALFGRAAALDPTFARAHAGLSFTHFQNAFLFDPARREAETARALEAAGRGLMADERDPAAHWAMGRALWLQGANDQAIAELETSVDLSPSFALGHYALAFVKSQSGDATAAIEAADRSRRLSPFDPLLFAILGSRAIALLRLGAREEAAECAIDAAARPNAHVHAQALAAYCLAVTERVEEARRLAALVRTRAPDYRLEQFFAAFRLDAETKALIRAAAARAGMA